MATSEPTVAFENARCIRQSAKAILCLIDGEELWFPQSHVHEDSEVFHLGDEGKLIVTEWIAKEKGLI